MSKKLTVDQIKEQLDEKEIEYKSNMNRDELLDLLSKEQEKEEGIQDTDTTSEKESAEDTETDAKEEMAVTKEAPKPKRYVVLHDFKDLEDNGTIYFEGDIYPRRAYTEVSEERAQELLSAANKRKKPLIKVD